MISREIASGIPEGDRNASKDNAKQERGLGGFMTKAELEIDNARLRDRVNTLEALAEVQSRPTCPGGGLPGTWGLALRACTRGRRQR